MNIHSNELFHAMAAINSCAWKLEVEVMAVSCSVNFCGLQDPWEGDGSTEIDTTPIACRFVVQLVEWWSGTG